VKRHIVVLGLSDKSSEFAQELLAEGRSVVVVDSASDHPGLPAARRSGALVVVGDAAIEQTQRLARVERSHRVVISTGDDGRNLRTAETTVRLMQNLSEGSVHVLLSDYSLHEELARIEFTTSVGSGPVVDFFHRADAEAASFIESVTAKSAASFESGVIRFDGNGERARRTLLHLARRNLLLGAQTKVMADDDTQRSVVDPVTDEASWVAEVMTPGRIGDDLKPAVCLVATSESDGNALGRALRLAHAYPDAEVFVLTDFPVGESLFLGTANLQAIPAGSVAVSPASLFSHSWVDTLARARHQIYCALEMQRGTDPAANESIVPWTDLPEPLKESNRDFARSVSRVLGGLPLRLVPLRGLPQEAPALLDDRLEGLAREEHDRWARDLIAKGWRWGPAPKDPERLTHPLLVDWDELSEPEREKDRDSVRSIPTMLALVGLEIEAAS
jgi:voltage-gated potassium channel Kch